jgi:two-component system chemotaxis sensor kinase CheA
MSGLPKEALDEYIGETREMCERVSINLGRVEKKEHDDETLNSIYRDMHSIKGSSHLFGFRHVGDLAHAMETALDPIRHKTVQVGSEIMDALYGGLDLISKMMESIIAKGEEGAENVSALSGVVPRIVDLTVASLGGDGRASSDKVLTHETKSSIGATAQSPASAPVSRKSEPAPAAVVSVKPADPAPQQAAAQPAQPKIAAPVMSPEPSPAASFGGSAASGGSSGGSSGGGSRPRKSDEAEKKDAASGKDEHAADASTIRIQVGLLDNLMNLIGELVLVRNQVLQFSDRNLGTDFQKLSQRLNVVTSELQNDVMKTRMQPVGTILTKFHRVVRDMSRDLGKKIELKLEGTETELDKTLIEAVKDPLTHLIRNSVDHGLEKPEDRKKSGKSDTGTVLIRSYHEGGQVIIEINDDGRGLSRVKIGRKAVEKGLLTEDQLARMSDRDVQAMIFAPGFSTAEKVSNISGRGVGMDVVKTNIERIGGTIDLQSVEGAGTTIRLRIPLTLAIIPALVVKADNCRFAIPQVKVVELVRLERDKSNSGRIELLQGRPVYRLRGDLLPLVDLRAMLKIAPDEPEKLKDMPIANIVVLSSESGMFGLIVSEIVDSADIVVKPLSNILKSLSAYSGATIMGDGTVVLILDVAGISSIASLNSGVDEHTRHRGGESAASGRSVMDIAEYLVVDLGVPGKYAIPLCLVNRLEEFDQNAIERTGEQRVVRYRDALLPLIDIAKHLALPGSSDLASDTHGKAGVVVMSKLNRLFGLRVKGIVDVVQIDANIDSDLSDRPGILGSVIRGKEVVVILDAHKIVDDSVQKLSGGSTAPTTAYKLRDTKPVLAHAAKNESDARAMRAKFKILLAEDTAFFRRHVKAYLEGAGFQVTAVVNGDEALRRLEGASSQDFNLIVTDIEMPIVDGFELVKRIRARQEMAALPVIALTTRVRKVDIDRGAQVGFTAYLEKFNGEVLLQQIDRIFGVVSDL